MTDPATTPPAGDSPRRKIQLLADALINKIAAGATRLSAAIKEGRRTLAPCSYEVL